MQTQSNYSKLTLLSKYQNNLVQRFSSCISHHSSWSYWFGLTSHLSLMFSKATTLLFASLVGFSLCLTPYYVNFVAGGAGGVGCLSGNPASCNMNNLGYQGAVAIDESRNRVFTAAYGTIFVVVRVINLHLTLGHRDKQCIGIHHKRNNCCRYHCYGLR
jgi:hypothetical protein